MRGIIDRFEGDFAVVELENSEIVNIPLSKFPRGIKEGDVIIIDGEKVYFDKNETLKRKNQIEKFMNKLFE